MREVRSTTLRFSGDLITFKRDSVLEKSSSIAYDRSKTTNIVTNLKPHGAHAASTSYTSETAFCLTRHRAHDAEENIRIGKMLGIGLNARILLAVQGSHEVACARLRAC